jgi:hypothetical protein
MTGALSRKVAWLFNTTYTALAYTFGADAARVARRKSTRLSKCVHIV